MKCQGRNPRGQRVSFDILRKIPEGQDRESWRLLLGEHGILPEDQADSVKLCTLLKGEARIRMLQKIHAMLRDGTIKDFLPEAKLQKILGRDWKKYVGRKTLSPISDGVFLPVYPDIRYVVMFCLHEKPPVNGMSISSGTRSTFSTEAKARTWIFNSYATKALKKGFDCWIIKVNGKVKGLNSIDGVVCDIKHVHLPSARETLTECAEQIKLIQKML